MTPLIFVWLGKNLPDWGKIALTFAKTLSGSTVILITNRSAGVVSEVDDQYFVEDFYQTPVDWGHTSQMLDSNFREGFWLKTTERFFVLEQFMEFYGIKSAFHAELDNWIFDLSGLATKLDRSGSGLFCPRDSIDRGIASLIYVNDISALRTLTQCSLKNSLIVKNDMAVIGYLLSSSTQFFSLCTENAFQPAGSIAWNTVGVDASGGIFDAASIGQFLFGIDPRNGSILMSNGFKNEEIGFELWQLRYELDFRERTFTVTNPINHQRYNLFNIHVHSKLFSQLADHGRLHRILNRINHGKKTLMSIDLTQSRIAKGLRSRLIKYWK